MRFASLCAAFSSAALILLSACSSGGSDSSRPIVGFTGYNQSSIPNVPFLNLDIRKHTYNLTYNDRVCVFNGGDMLTDTGTRYQNSGRFVQRMVVRTMRQYSLESIVDMKGEQSGVKDASLLQDPARNNSCNVIAVTYPVYWQDSQISPGNVGIRIEMFDTSSLQRLNYVTLNARSNYIRDMFLKNSPLGPVVEKYVDGIYTGKFETIDY